MQDPPDAGARSLRGMLAWITVLVLVLVLIVSTALVVMTTRLHQMSTTIGAAVESVRLLEDAEVALLLHARASDAVVQHNLESELREHLGRARRYVTSTDEARILDEAQARLATYLAVARAGSPPNSLVELERAYAAFEALLDMNVAQARDEQEQADAWNRMANVLGTGVAVVMTLLAGCLLWWLRDRAFKPIVELAAAMHAYARGERHARAAEVGPSELREIVRRFNQMADALDARRSAETAFLAGVAHDIRNPLTALDMSAGLIGPNDPLPPEPRLRRTLALVRRQVKRLDRMVADFLDMTRIEAGQLQLRLERCDARDVAREVVELLESTAAGRRLSMSLSAVPVPLSCDPVRIEQVIGNLLGNALKYSDGEVTVIVDGERGDAVIRVHDRGAGISEDELARLFQPFHRAVSHDDVPGTGIGLFMVRRIVEAHGGRIDVRSRLGVGSEFVVRLPMDVATEVDPQRPLTPAAGRRPACSPSRSA
jgi:signal transduction histidine kinase